MARGDVIKEAAAAIREHARDSVHAHGSLGRMGEVKGIDPLHVAVDDLDGVLDESEGQVTLGETVRSHHTANPIAVGDSLVLISLPDGDWHALDLIRVNPEP